MTQNFFSLEDPKDFIIKRNVWMKIQEVKSEILDYDDSKYEFLRTELEELIDLFKEFEHALAVHDLMKSEIYRDKIMIDHVLKKQDLVTSVVNKTKNEIKSTIDKICENILSHLNEIDSNDSDKIKSFISSIEFNFTEFEDDFDYRDFNSLKYELKEWIYTKRKQLNKDLKQSLVDLYLNLHYFDRVYKNLISFKTAIALFYVLIEVVY